MADPWQILLLLAAKSHRERTGHPAVFRGMNFVECESCKRHAHIHNATGQLVLHDAEYHSVEIVKPEDF